MKRIIHVEVASSDAAARRLMQAWHAAEKGEAVQPTISVGSIAQLSALLSPKRMELLRYVAQNPGKNIREIAAALGRDYKNVYTDVIELAEQQLLEREDGKVSAPYDEIAIRAPLRRAA